MEEIAFIVAEIICYNIKTMKNYVIKINQPSYVGNFLAFLRISLSTILSFRVVKGLRK